MLKPYSYLIVRTLLCPYLVLLLSWSTFAQDLPCRFRNLTVTDGLSNPTVINITQDQRGYVWLGTNDGINRYDGIGMKSYYPSRAHDPESSTRESPILYAGGSGSLWLGYQLAAGKLFRYDARQDIFRAFAPRDDRPGGAIPDSVGVVALHEEAGEYLWVATSAAGLFRYDLQTTGMDTVPYRHFLSLPGDTTSLPTNALRKGICHDNAGRLWLATEQGLVRYQPDSQSFVTHRWSKLPEGNNALGMVKDEARNCLWVTTFYGLIRFDPATGQTKFYPPPGPSFNFMGSPTIDPEGRLWLNVGSYPASRLWVFDPETERYRRAVATTANGTDQLPGANDLYCDWRGRIWSGGFRRGLQIIDPSPPNVRRVDLQGMLPPGTDFNSGGITALVGSKSDLIFLGTAAQGLWQWDRAAEKLTPVSLPFLAGRNPAPRIFGLATTPDERVIYAVAGQSLYRVPLDGGAVTIIHPFMDLPDYSVYLTVRRFGEHLWLSCFGKGICTIPLNGNGDIKRFFSDPVEAPDGQPNLAFGSITDLQEGTRPGQLWLSSVFAGLVEWDDNTRKFTAHPMSRTIRRFSVAEDGKLWLATDAGFLHYDPQSGEILSEPSLDEDGLRFPRALVEDKRGLLWIAAEKGLTAVDPLSSHTKHRLFASTWLDTGEDWYAHEMFAYRHDGTGELFFANERGLFAVQPAKIRYDTVPPAIVLQAVTVNGRGQPLPETASEVLALPHYQNDLTFSVAALHYKSPERNQLRYRLGNFDAGWRVALPGQPLEYPNLPSGNYQLSVIAGNSDGATTPPREVVSLRIREPWYANAYAYVAYLALFLGLVYYFFRQQLARRREQAERQFMEELDVAKTHLFTNISHEFRTPLTLILGDGQALYDQLSGRARERAQRIRNGGQRLLWLVNQLLELAQADSGFLKLKPRLADILPFLRYNLEAFESLAQPRDIELRFRARMQVQWMDFDAERLQRVLSNLLVNAVRHAPDGGWVELSADLLVTAEDEYLQITVRDNGPGIPPEELPLIFDRFHRATHNKGGAGIGLALVREIVQLMGGSIRAENAPGAGAVFTLLLPISQSAPLEESPTLEAIPLPADGVTGPAPAAAPTNHSVLVIEDNDDLRRFLRACLADNYQLTMARDGVEGLELADDQEFDLIVSDVMMPRMDGFTVCQRLKAAPSTSHIPVILLTARVDLASRLEGFSRGADAYLPKPFDPRELRTRCEQLLRQRDRLRTYYRGLLGTAPPDLTAPPPEQPEEHAFIIRARTVVEAHLSDPDFSVEDLAREVHLSRSQLHRKLHQLVDMHTTRFIRSVRIQQARTLLRESSLTIAEIAYDCGFRDPDYFSRVFREEIGRTPSAYRNGK
ncbi:hybrid sensor histidine kinase/response regulator transcription factor [Neolewinella persica]|uniref:hybrid sensor histidine kinase/response regulator transcription factor n=1 Tax=Neolewinella persica TaxID=70998 RepID=UPI000476CCF8|nr:ATP-binding protein [Neolewinella persica]